MSSVITQPYKPTQPSKPKIKVSDIKALSELVNIRFRKKDVAIVELEPGYYPYRFSANRVHGDMYYPGAKGCPDCRVNTICDNCADGYDRTKIPAVNKKHKVNTKVPLPWLYLKIGFTPQLDYDSVRRTWTENIYWNVYLDWIRCAPKRIGKTLNNLYTPPLPNIYDEDRLCFYPGGDRSTSLPMAFNAMVSHIFDSWYNFDNFGRVEANGLWNYLKEKSGAEQLYDVTTIVDYWSKMTVEEFLAIPRKHWYYSAKVAEDVPEGQLLKAG